jgi:hypothetical protein
MTEACRRAGANVWFPVAFLRPLITHHTSRAFTDHRFLLSSVLSLLVFADLWFFLCPMLPAAVAGALTKSAFLGVPTPDSQNFKGYLQCIRNKNAFTNP